MVMESRRLIRIFLITSASALWVHHGHAETRRLPAVEVQDQSSQRSWHLASNVIDLNQRRLFPWETTSHNVLLVSGSQGESAMPIEAPPVALVPCSNCGKSKCACRAWFAGDPTAALRGAPQLGSDGSFIVKLRGTVYPASSASASSASSAAL